VGIPGWFATIKIWFYHLIMFVHLHTHSDNSILNGVIKVDKIVKKAKDYGMPAIALTDNGSMYPTYSFWSKCNAEGVKPIIGLHANLAPRTRFDKESGIDQKTSELVLLAKNLTGYLNLVKIVSYSHIEGFYYRPRIDKELLEKYHEGIIVLSGGSYGEIQKNLYLGNDKEAEEIAKYYKKVFGDDFYLEIQRLGMHSEQVVEPKLIALGEKLCIELVATNDVYYEKQEDSEVREVLWCIDGGKLMSDPSRRRPDSDQNYFKTPEEMEELFKDLPQAIENTVKIAEKVERYNIGFGKVQPVYPKIPEGETEESYLRKLVYELAPERFGYWNDEVKNQIEYELKIIHDKGYDGYFLVVWDVANWARTNGFSVKARGSAAGTAIGYALGIASVDPLKWKLFFERFLNPERKSLPDIDLDIADNQRDQLIEYVKKTYGSDSVANIGALGKLTTKAAIRDVGRVLGIELSIIDKLSKLVPVTFGRVLSINAMIADELAGKDIKIVNDNRAAIDEFRQIIKELPEGKDDDNSLEEITFCEACQEAYFIEKKDTNKENQICKKCNAELKVIAKASNRFFKLLKYARKIENCIRNISTHACGFLITAPKPIIDYCPIQIESGSGKRIITQFEGKYLEEVGLMKFDFLGVANLSIIDNAVKMVKKSKGIDIDIYNLPEDDKKTFELLRKADTKAIFQLESSGMRKYLRELQPENLEEISALLALYRPGPLKFIPNFIDRKFGREEVKYLIPEIEEIMKISYGLPVYQEQILQIANQIAGYSLGQADNLRRAIGKKLPEVMAAEEKNFKEGFLKKFPNYGEDIANKLWEYALPFADYGFNKSHTAAYAYISYQTAYLKANYPTEFFASLMLSDIDNLDKLTRDILDAEAHGIKLLPPSINKSDTYFRIEEEGIIRFGIGGLKGVGLKTINAIVDERNKNGEFTSLDDLCARIDHKSVPKGAIESLIKIGALDEFGKRSAMLQIFEDIYSRSAKSKQAESTGFMDMFGAGVDNSSESKIITKLPDIPEVDDLQKIEWEKGILGVPVTPSLLMKLVPYLESKNYKLIHDLQETPDNTQVKIFGQITRLNEVTTKKGDLMCFLEVSDTSGPVSVTVFPRIYDKCEEFALGNYLHIKGKTQKRNDEMQLIADEIKVIPDYELKTVYDKWRKKNNSTSQEISKSVVKKETYKNVSLEDKTAKSQTVNEHQTGYQPEKAKDTVQEKSINAIEIFVNKDADIEELKRLSSILRQSIKEDGIEIYVHVPNHVESRMIKLEGKYDPEVSKIANKIIEKVSIS
jgi:DNA polymerase-3 subunit alpha